MLFTVMFFAIISAAIEIIIVSQVEWLETFLLKHDKLGLVFSFALSLALGKLFHAEGTIMSGAAVMSTLITICFYKMHGIKYIKKAKSAEFKTNLQARMDRYARNARTLWRFFTAPFRAIIWVRDQIDTVKVKVQSVKTHLTRS